MTPDSPVEGATLVRQVWQGRSELLMRGVSAVLIFSCVVVLALGGAQVVFTTPNPAGLGAIATQIVAAVAALGMIAWGRADYGLIGFFVGLLLASGIGQLNLVYEPALSIPRHYQSMDVVFSTVLLSGILLKRQGFRPVAVAALIPIGMRAFAQLNYGVGDSADVWNALGVGIVILVVNTVVFEYIWAQEETDREVIEGHLERLEVVAAGARLLSTGDLTQPVGSGDGVGEEVEMLRMTLFYAIEGIRAAALEVGQAAVELEATATLQSTGMTEQAAAVAETRATMSSVSLEAQDIEGIAAEVDLRTGNTTEQAALLETVLGDLIRTSERVGTLLEEIRGIADKSDLLALNASLEGVRAGEAGRGFALVAAQMQQLSERVRQSVGDLQTLNGQVVDASERSRDAMNHTRLHAEAARSAAVDIRERASRQGQAMSQVDQSIAEIAEVTHRVSSGTSQLESAAGRLVELVSAIEQTIGVFRTKAKA